MRRDPGLIHGRRAPIGGGGCFYWGPFESGPIFSYFGVNGDGIAGDPNGFWVACVFAMIGASPGDYLLYHGNVIAARGWSLRLTGGGALTFRVADGTGTPVDVSGGSPTHGKIHAAIAWFDGSAARIVMDNGSAAGTACVGYTPPDPADPNVFGAGGSAFEGGKIQCAMGADSAYPTPAQRLGFWTQAKLCGCGAYGETGGETLNPAADHKWAAPDPTDRIGSDDLVPKPAGSGVPVSRVALPFAW